MIMGQEPLRMFVAMPGTTMGRQARWADITEIKRRLLQPVADRLRERLDRPVLLVIEKDKLGSEVIYPSMFRETIESDIYIADLSGENANVYLELGVRWALHDGPTLLISQDVGSGRPLPFNVSANRVIPYGPMPDELDHAVDQIVASVLEALGDPAWVDSPVRTSIPLVIAPKSDWDGLRQRVRELEESQADDLVAAARKAVPVEAVKLLQLAIDRNQVSVQAHFQLGVLLREMADYPAAIRELRSTVSLTADWAPGWRELGVALSQAGQLAEAAAAFQRAVELDRDDAEAWSNLGGLRRRLARSSAEAAFDWAMLREAGEAYGRASRLRGNDTYSLVNKARVELLLSAATPQTRPAVLNELRSLQNLARYEADKDDPTTGKPDPWKVFDLADTLLLSGSVADGLAKLRGAIELTDLDRRTSNLASVIGPLRDFLAADVLDEQTAAGVHEAVRLCEQAIEAATAALA